MVIAFVMLAVSGQQVMSGHQVARSAATMPLPKPLPDPGDGGDGSGESAAGPKRRATGVSPVRVGAVGVGAVGVGAVDRSTGRLNQTAAAQLDVELRRGKVGEVLVELPDAQVDSTTQGANAAVPQPEQSAAQIPAQIPRPEPGPQFDQAQPAVPGPGGQQQPQQVWIADQDQEPTTAVTTAGSHATDPAESDPAAPDPVQAVIDRAWTQLGVRYSWGGGDAYGPTVGIRDGGAGDVHGDYHQAGFDCSGLMIYAFSAVLGYSLPHSSGAQYHLGRQVPLSARLPGDLLFWGSKGRIHHVALYIGDGQMIEAPYSGAAVRVTPVYYGGIMPHVARLL